MLIAIVAHHSRRTMAEELASKLEADATEKSRKQQSCCSGSGPERTA